MSPTDEMNVRADVRRARRHVWSMYDEIATALLSGESPAAVCARYGLERSDLTRIVALTPSQPVASW